MILLNQVVLYKSILVGTLTIIKVKELFPEGEGSTPLLFALLPNRYVPPQSDMIFARFCSENGYKLCLPWSEFGYSNMLIQGGF